MTTNINSEVQESANTTDVNTSTVNTTSSVNTLGGSTADSTVNKSTVYSKLDNVESNSPIYVKKLSALLLVLFFVGFVFVRANPFGMFDSDEIKKFKKIVATNKEISSLVSEKDAVKTILSEKMTANNTKIEDAKTNKKNAELSICGLNSQLGKEEINTDYKCNDQEYDKYLETIKKDNKVEVKTEANIDVNK